MGDDHGCAGCPAVDSCGDVDAKPEASKAKTAECKCEKCGCEPCTCGNDAEPRRTNAD